MLEESLVNGRVPDAATTCNAQLASTQTVPQQHDRNFSGLASKGTSTQQTVEDLEAGRS